MYGIRRAGKPLRAAPIDWRNPLTRGLMGCYALTEGSGLRARDAARNVDLGPGTVNPTWGAGALGGGLVCNAASASLVGAIPAALQLSWPITAIVVFEIVGTPSSFEHLWGAVCNTSNSNPYLAWSIGTQNSNSLRFGWSNAGAFQSFSPTNTLPSGVPIVVGATWQPGQLSCYLGGRPAGGTTANLSGSPTYQSTASLALGDDPGTGRTGASIYFTASWWARALSADEHASYAADPWQVFAPTYDWGALSYAAAAAFMPWIFGDQLESSGLG